MSIQNPLIATAIASLKRVLTTHQLTVAWSGGKDSSVVLGLALQAARELKAEGFEIQPLVVTHGDSPTRGHQPAQRRRNILRRQCRGSGGSPGGLGAEGFQVPQYAIDALRDEAAEDRADDD
jgi:hypothetical protein